MSAVSYASSQPSPKNAQRQSSKNNGAWKNTPAASKNGSKAEPPTSVLSENERRSALAVLAMLVPGGGKIAAADEQTLALVEGTLVHMAPQVAAGFGKFALMLDHLAIASTGKRLRSLSRAKADKLLQKWEADPLLRGPITAIAAATKLAHFDRPNVYGALGGKLNVVQNVETPKWLGQVIPAHKHTDQEDVECEVVVIGTGAGGAVVGKELAEKGYAVVFVEEGKMLFRDSFTGSSLQTHNEFYRGGLSAGNAVFPIFMGKMVGGSTAINTGTCFRTPNHVLSRMCETIETNDFAPENMNKYFDRVEEILQVEEADARYIGAIQNVFKTGCDALGWSHAPMKRNAPGCEGEGFCDFGCRTDARKSTNLSYMPPALTNGSLLFTELRADRLMMENGRAVGVECFSVEGDKRIRVRANAVVLAAGALPSPAWLSKQGLCNSSGELGKNLTLHPSGGVTAMFDYDISGPKHIPQGYGSTEFLESDSLLFSGAQPDWNYAPMTLNFSGNRLMEVMNQYDRMGSFGSLIADEARGRLLWDSKGGQTVLYNLTRGDVDRMHRGLIRLSEMCFAAGARIIYPAVAGQPPITNDSEFEAFKKAKLRATDLLLTSYHPLGTAKMGHDPKTSVIDLNHQTHDVPGLFVVDGSAVQGPLGVNPQITIMAIATRAAERIASLLG